MEGREQLERALDDFLDASLEKLVLSNPRDPLLCQKAVIRPVLLKAGLCFQAEQFQGNQAFHQNLSKQQVKAYIMQQLETQFKQAQLVSASGTMHVLVSKKGGITVKEKRLTQPKAPAPLLSHNRQKQYILSEGTPIPFLVSLGVMTREGKVVHAKYDKFRQINRFLEFIEDILPKLDADRENTILDFGCGKSYLTFAMYYYLKEMKGYPIRIIGLDLKQDVIQLCNRLARQFGFDTLSFLQGDIAQYDGVEQVDMVVTLHACDLATDYALFKAVGWGAKVILSVPCCQHELNGQIKSELLGPVLSYGLIKERMAALLTDGLRAEILEGQGYRTQILEFIDMEHTPKNILIRAVKQGEKKDNQKELLRLMEQLHINPTLYNLFH